MFFMYGRISRISLDYFSHSNHCFEHALKYKIENSEKLKCPSVCLYPNNCLLQLLLQVNRVKMCAFEVSSMCCPDALNKAMCIERDSEPRAVR